MPIHKATIIPRGRALGMVQGLPERDQISQSYEQFIAMLAMAMGGRVAEELVFGHDKVTSGAASDIQQCTRVARAMVTQLGFSDKLGTVAYADPQQEQFLGYSLGRQVTLSEATQQTIDAEVRRGPLRPWRAQRRRRRAPRRRKGREMPSLNNVLGQQRRSWPFPSRTLANCAATLANAQCCLFLPQEHNAV